MVRERASGHDLASYFNESVYVIWAMMLMSRMMKART
jgi:hypothetical protein